MILFYAIFIILCLLAGIWDFLFYRIPNKLIGIMLFLFCVMEIFAGGRDLAYVGMGFALFLFLGFVFYLLKLVGAGDAKLFAVISLWAMHVNVMGLFVLVTCVTGGILGLIYVSFSEYVDRIREKILLVITPYLQQYATVSSYVLGPMQLTSHRERSKILIPYGMAMCLAALVVLKNI